MQDCKLLDLEAKKEAPETPEKHNKVGIFRIEHIPILSSLSSVQHNI